MKWLSAPWAAVEPGDFLKIKNVVFRVEARDGGKFHLVDRDNRKQVGSPPLDDKVDVRIELSGQPTPAASRLGEDLSAISALLREKLDAEFLAWRDESHTDKRFFKPFICPEVTPKTRSDFFRTHLFQMHGVHVGDLKTTKEDGKAAVREELVSLRETHEELHELDRGKYSRPHRIAHVHHGGAP